VANTPQAKKRARQAEGTRQQNKGVRTRMRTYIKHVLKAVESGDKELAKESLAKAIPVIDSTCSKGIIHKNTAARYKSRLNTRVKNLVAN